MAPLEYDESYAKIAQKWSNNMMSRHSMYHSEQDFRPGCGENVGYNWDLKAQWYSGSQADAWYDEISEPGYNYNVPGYYQNPGTGHMTVMIWSTTKKIGCGI